MPEIYSNGGNSRKPGNGSGSGSGTERELKASLLKLYQTYDTTTDEYDKLYDIIDALREEYNNCKHFFIYRRYKEFKRIIKNAVRKWRTTEKRISLQTSKRMSNAGQANFLHNTGTGASPGGTLVRDSSVPNMPLTNNLAMRIRSYSSSTTRDLFSEGQRLEKEIMHYKTKNQQMRNMLLKMASDYDTSKAHVLHIYGRYKELRVMIKEVIDADI